MSARALRPAPEGRDELAATLAQIEAALRELPVDRIPDAVGALARLQAILALRLAGTGGGQTPDRLLRIEEAAELLSLDEGTLYRKAKDLPFTRRIDRQLRFSAAGLDRYIRGKTR